MAENDEKSSERELINRFYLRFLREAVADLTQEEVATEMDVTLEYVKNWETGRTQPNLKHQASLEKLFGIKPGSLAWSTKHILFEDFSAAYFGDESARERIEWIDTKRKIARSLDLLPAAPKKRKS